MELRPRAIGGMYILSRSHDQRGYAMESKCHVGRVCQYELEGGIDSTKHGLQTVLDMIQGSETVPACVVEKDCVDCEAWTFVEEEDDGTEEEVEEL